MQHGADMMVANILAPVGHGGRGAGMSVGEIGGPTFVPTMSQTLFDPLVGMYG